MMKRKKWTEEEEETLINKYSDLLRSGTLSKLKTRQKKFDPIADHLNSLHHLRDPDTFPFRWSWRDVSIKIQNMRHQYLGVKQKIKLPAAGHFNWSDGENHWPNFLKYKHVFGDHDLDLKDPTNTREFRSNAHNESGNTEEEDPVFDFVGEDVLGLGLGLEADDDVPEEEDDDEKEDDVVRRGSKGFLRKRDRELKELEEGELARSRARARREYEGRWQLEREMDDERRRRMEMEEMREEEEMEWRARMLGMQMEHEKQTMQMYSDAFHNQMQILGVLVRLVCQFFGGGGDGLGGGLPGQVLQHPGGLVGDNGKGDANSGAHFM